MRAAVEREEILAFKLKLDGHHRSGRTAVNLKSFLAVPAYFSDVRILETRDVKFCRFLGLVIVPKARRNLL
jgi:hypothetical protein